MTTKLSLQFEGKPIEVNRSSKGESWRMVHNGKSVIHFFLSSGFTTTKNFLFTGTKEECLKEAKSLGLSGADEALNRKVLQRNDARTNN